MNVNVKRLVVLLMSAMLMAGMLGAGSVFASSKDGNDQALSEIARQFADKTKDPFGYRSAKESRKLELDEDLPSKFDLTAKFIKDGDETSYVTPVKFQNPFGSCWGFAAIAAAETSILGEGIAPGYAARADEANNIKGLDLSEKHVINFLTKPLNDPSSPQNGEGMYYVEKNLKLTDKFDYGGFPIYATNMFASGIGPNKEDRSVPEGLQQNIFEYKGLNEEISQNKVNGKWADFCYSEDDDWDMPEELRFKQSYTLEESYILPCPAKRVENENSEDGESALKYEYDPLGTLAIKKQLMNKRAVEIGFCADVSMPDQESEGIYISENWAHYTNNAEEPADHAVTIVGWDDNYPKTNFIEGKQPPENGAWLVKNSWGSGEEEFPNHGYGDWGIPIDKLDENGDPVIGKDGKPEKVGSGYFWLSYYDQSLDSPEALNFSAEVPSEGYYLDQHDFMPVLEIETAEIDNAVSMSNVFKAEVNEQLKEISFMTSVPGTTAEYEVYLLASGYKTPVDGLKVASGSAGPFEFGGFHKVSLPDEDEVVVQKGQCYSIVITLKTPSNEYSLNIPTGQLKEMAESFGDIAWQKGIINKGESFVSIDGKWYDYTDEKLQERVFEGMQYMISLDNFPIKGYCKELQDLNMYLLGEDPMKLPPYEIEWSGGTPVTKTLNVRFRKGKGAVMPEDPEITWAVNEGSEGIVDLQVNENDSSRAALKAKKPGTAFIVVSAEGIGHKIVRVDVPKSGWYDVWDVGDLEYGKTELASISNFDGTEVPKSTFTFTSDNPKVATVSASGLIKAVGTGKTVIRAADKNGVEEQISVRVVKTTQKMSLKGKKITLKASSLKKKSKTVKRAKLITIKNAVGKKTFKKVKGNKKITINKKTGKVTVKKGLKKGTYKVIVKVTAAGNKNYKAMSKNVKITIKVK